MYPIIFCNSSAVLWLSVVRTSEIARAESVALGRSYLCTAQFKCVVDSSSDQWREQHQLFKQLNLENQDKIAASLERHWNGQYSTTDPKKINAALMQCIEHVCCEYSYGKAANVDYFRKFRQLVIRYLTVGVYAASFLHVPILGRCITWYSRYKYRSVSDDIQLLARQLYQSSTSDSWVRSVQSQLGEEAALENSVLMCNIVDFLHNVFIDYLLRQSTLETSIKHGFFFPVRPRRTRVAVELEPGVVIAANSLVYVDLLRSKQYFSSGPRACPGQSLVNHVFEPFIKNLQRTVTKCNLLIYNSNSERPFLVCN